MQLWQGVAMDPGTGSNAFDGRQAYTDALRTVLVGVGDASPRELWWVDACFTGWPLDEPEVLEALTRWLRRPARRLVVIGGDFAQLARDHPRFTRWRCDHGHVIEAWEPLVGERIELDAVLIAGPTAIELVDRMHWRGRTLSEPSAVRELTEHVASLLHRCQSAWPITTLGL
jgi:hypothetical protein